MLAQQPISLTASEAFELDGVLVRQGAIAALRYVQQHLHLPTTLAKRLVQSRQELVASSSRGVRCDV